MHRTAIKNIKKIIIIMRFIISGIELNRLVIASFNPRFLFNNFNGLRTLKTLNDLIAFNPLEPADIEITADVTITKSRMFQPSRM